VHQPDSCLVPVLHRNTDGPGENGKFGGARETLAQPEPINEIVVCNSMQ